MNRLFLRCLVSLSLLAGCLSACSPNGTGTDLPDTDTDTDTDTDAVAPDSAFDDFEMGCPGFDSSLVPDTYISMKPCLQQLRWTLHVTRTKTMVFQDDTSQMDMRDDFDVSARGEQLVWRWEENGSSAGNYLLSGKNNSVSELLVQRSGNASLNGHARFTNRVLNEASSEQIAVAGPVDGTLLTGLGATPGDPVCVEFHINMQMRGSYSIALTPAATPEWQDSGMFLATQFERTPDDVWNIKDEYRSFSACTGAPQEPLTYPYDAGSWAGLKADESAGTWSLQASKTIALPDSAQAEHWTIDLQVNRVPRTALPAPERR